MKMKGFLAILLLLVFMTGAAYPLLTHDQDFYIKNKRTVLSGTSNDPLYQFIGEVDDLFSGTDGVNFLLYTPTTAPATAAKGQLYFDLSSSNFKYYTTSWQTVGSSTSSTLDEAYSAGQGITVDAGAVTLTTSAASDSAALAIVHGETGNYAGMTLSNASAYPGLQFTTTGDGADITGTSTTWSISKAGALVCVGVDTTGNITLANDETILNDTNNEIQFGNGTEDISFGFGTSDTLALTTDTDVATIAFGDLDAFTGVASITGDAGADFALGTTNTGTYNFTIAQSGTGDNELRLTSAGTAANAIALTTATGGITLTAADDVTMAITDDLIITAADDISINSNSASGIVNLGTNNDGITINVGTDDTAADTINIGSAKDTTTVTGVGVTLASGTSDITLDSGDDIFLTADTGTGDVINLSCVKGTADASIVIASTVGGIDADAAKSIHITSSEETGDAIYLHASGTAGGVDITSGTGDLALVSTDDITLTVNTTTTDNITLTNTPGTATDAIAITATAGGITTTSANVASTWTHTANSAADDLTFALAGAVDSSIILTSAGTGEDALSLLATGTSASNMSILMDTADGGIIIRADGSAKGDILVDAEDDVTITAAGKTIFNLGAEASTYQGNLLPATVKKQTITTGSLTTEHCGYCNQVAVDAQTITLPATVAGVAFWIMCTAADGQSVMTIELDNSDHFIGAGITTSDGEAIVLAKGTQNYGDYVKVAAHTDGWIITELVGTWAEASP